MPKHRKRRRSSSHKTHRRRRSNPRRSLMLFGAAPRKHRRHRSVNRHFGRRRSSNPGIGSIVGGKGGILPLVVGGGVGFLAARMIPQNLLANYNKGWAGYALNAASGIVVGYGLGKVWSRQAAIGAYVGTGVAVLSRIIVEQFNVGGGGGVSGDLDFDLGYYLSDRFPYPQGDGGPYAQFPGNPYLANAPFGPTSAAAVRGGQAAAAALPAAPAAMHGSAGRSSLEAPGRWSDSRWT